jgi:hypothetical protein
MPYSKVAFPSDKTNSSDFTDAKYPEIAGIEFFLKKHEEIVQEGAIL